MRLPSLSWTLAVAALLSTALACASDDPPRGGTGSPDDRAQLTAFELDDQHGAPGRVDAGTRVLLATRDMDGGRALRDALEALGADDAWLAARGAVVVADIHRMPGFAAEWFALPALRKRPYRMLIDRAGEATAALPGREGMAALVFLDRLSIERVAYAGTPDEVRALLDTLEAGSAPGTR